MDPLDEALARRGDSRFAGMDEVSFLSAVGDAVANAGGHE
jgi:hypothetical protein